MSKPPDVCGLVLCRKITVDMANRRMSLDDIFLLLRIRDFPAPVGFRVYAALFDGRGEGEMSLVCTHLESEADVYYHRRWLSFAQAGRTVHYEIVVRSSYCHNLGDTA